MLKSFKNLTTKRKALLLGRICLPILIGGTAGYLYYHYIGCVSGHCPITGNPYISTIYGSIIGAIFIKWRDKEK